MIYLERVTFFHRLDPRTKIFASIACAGLIVILSTPLSLFLLFITLLACLLSMRPPVSSMRLLLRILFIVLMTTMLSQGLFYYFEPRTPLLTIIGKDSGPLGKLTGGILLYKEGLIYGMIQSMRFFSATAMSTILVMSTHPSDLILGLKKLGVPEKIAFMLTVSIRFLPVLLEEARRILVAQRLRGLKLTGLRGNLRGFRYLVVPLVIDSLRHARRVAIAAEVRGFTGKRTEIRELHFNQRDVAVLCGAAIIMGIAAVCRFRL
jgi:energy-coupling factor transport system permease protein